MNIDELREEIASDEGKVIPCTPTIKPTYDGYIPFINEWDEEYGKPVGTPVSEERVNDLFDKDIEVTISECKELFDNFDELPEEVQKICANMMFNMGRPRLADSRNFVRIANNDWQECAPDGRQSLAQTGH